MSSKQNITYSEELVQAAEAGDLDAQCNLGLCYSDALGVEKNYKKAAFWFAKAAAKNHAPALHNLGHLNSIGCGVTKNWATALKLWRKAARSGYAPSINNIGYYYEKGLGVTQNYKTALLWYRKAAELDLPDAMFEVGRYHYEGLGVKQNLEEAYYWLYTASVLGDADSEELAREIQRQLGKEITDRIKGEAWPRLERIFNEIEAARASSGDDDKDEGTGDVPPPPEGLFTGGDGSSFEQAVKVNPSFPGEGVNCEYYWLNLLGREKGLGWERGLQRLAHEGGVPYDILEVIWSDGTTQDVYFDISGFYGRE